jgi:hypothetical protein
MDNLSSLIFYFIAFLSSTILFYLGERKSRKTFYFISAFIIIIIGGFRFGVGTDYSTYVILSKEFGISTISNYLSNNGIFEFGFYLMSKMSEVITSGPYLMFFISNLIVVVLNFIAIRKVESNHKYLFWLFFLLTIYPLTLNAIRQAISISIFFYIFVEIYRGNFKRAILMSFIPMLFHKTGIIVIPISFLLIYFSKKKDYSIKLIFPFFLFTILIYFNFFNIISQISFFDGYLKYEHLYYYANNLSFYQKLLFLLVIIFLRKKIINTKFTYLLFIMFYFDFIFSIFGFITPVLKRMGLYFYFGGMLLLPNFLEITTESKKRKYIRVVIIAYSIAYFIFAHYYLKHSGIFPYSTIFFIQ